MLQGFGRLAERLGIERFDKRPLAVVVTNTEDESADDVVVDFSRITFCDVFFFTTGALTDSAED